MLGEDSITVVGAEGVAEWQRLDDAFQRTTAASCPDQVRVSVAFLSNGSVDSGENFVISVVQGS